LLRTLIEEQIEYISLTQSREPVEIGGVVTTPAEAYFLFSVLSAHGLLTFDDRREGSGIPLLMNIRVKRQGVTGS
jgi:hypothetical protein